MGKGLKIFGGIALLILGLLVVLLVLSRGRDGGASDLPRKCAPSFGLTEAEQNFSTTSASYRAAVKALHSLRQNMKVDIGDIADFCGYKVENSRTCYRFIDVDHGLGHRVCIRETDGKFSAYELEI